MVSFFKSLGRGILYVIGLPFIIAYVAIYAVIAFFIIAFMFFKATILFFRGKSLFDDLEEDKKAKAILENVALKNQPITPAYGMYGQTPQNVYQNNQGAAVARNKGMEYATGEYVSFLDADDFYEAEMFDCGGGVGRDGNPFRVLREQERI